jgi:hypothetical protein
MAHNASAKNIFSRCIAGIRQFRAQGLFATVRLRFRDSIAFSMCF